MHITPTIIVITIIVGIVLTGAGFFAYRQLQLNDFSQQTRGGALAEQNVPMQNSADAKEIMVTGGVKHSVPLDEIVAGGPAKDGIPSIDEPQFVSAVQASEWLGDDAVGLALDFNGVQRFYPFQILVWHEIVNDTIGGQRVLITYCPLCFSGVVFDPLVDGERVEFGTSGKLWQSNLVMYDRATDSYWSQILGEAIVGEMTGTRLTPIPSDIMQFGNWRDQHPNGSVLSRDTGAARDYGRDPYGDYYTTPGTYFPLQNTDSRLPDKTLVLGIIIDGQAKAYPIDVMKERGRVTDVVGDTTLTLSYDTDIDTVRMFSQTRDGTLTRLAPLPNFWFSWAAAHPTTKLFE